MLLYCVCTLDRELEIATYGVGVADAAAAEVGGAAPTDPLVADICTEFAVCLQTFEESSKVRVIACNNGRQQSQWQTASINSVMLMRR